MARSLSAAREPVRRSSRLAPERAPEELFMNLSTRQLVIISTISPRGSLAGSPSPWVLTVVCGALSRPEVQ